MLWSMVLSELRTRYKGSVLGFLWTFVNPLLTLLVYSVIFTTIMRVRLSHYPVFLFIGILSWNMFSTAAQASAGVVIRQASLVKKIYFPREILPISVVGGSLINFLLSLIVLVPFLLISGIAPSWNWAYLPLIVLVEALITAGFSLLFSSINVYFRDLEHMLNIFLMLWFYLTPVVYSLSMIPHKMGQLFKLNPIADVVLSYQDVFYYGTSIHWKLFAYTSLFAVSIFALGVWVFYRLSMRFAEEV